MMSVDTASCRPVTSGDDGPCISSFTDFYPQGKLQVLYSFRDRFKDFRLSGATRCTWVKVKFDMKEWTLGPTWPTGVDRKSVVL